MSWQLLSVCSERCPCFVLQDAARYFQDVLMLSGEDEDVAAALDTCMSDLEDFSSMS